jgi:hypothetical protein
MSERDTVENCDGAFWYITTETNDNSENTILNTDFYKFKNGTKAVATEIGFKYNILLFKENEVEYTRAVLGDPRGYICRLGKMGYNGLLVKVDSVPKKTLKGMVQKIMGNFSFPNSKIKNILKQV